MTNLRELAESHLEKTLENPNHFGLPIILISPSGVTYDAIYGQVLYDTRKVDAEMGIEVIVHDPVVTVRRSSLTRIPLASEKGQWACKIPSTPSPTAATETYLVGRPSEDGSSIGFVRLYLSRTVQS